MACRPKLVRSVARPYDACFVFQELTHDAPPCDESPSVRACCTIGPKLSFLDRVNCLGSVDMNRGSCASALVVEEVGNLQKSCDQKICVMQSSDLHLDPTTNAAISINIS